MKPIFVFFLAVHLISASAPGFAQQEVGARQFVDRLLQSLGGREHWASARSIYIREQAFPASVQGPVTAEFWRGLDIPAYRSLIIGSSIRRETVWSEEGGWVIRDGRRTEMPEETLQAEILDWRQEPYVMYHKLAKRDPTLRLTVVDGNRLEIFDRKSGALLCWFVVDVSGALLRWGNYYQGQVSEHVYGPLRDFGDVRMPAWGTSITGSWRFEYREVRLMKESLDF